MSLDRCREHFCQLFRFHRMHICCLSEEQCQTQASDKYCRHLDLLQINMSYTRKEIVNWVQSQSKYKFQELKNGVFFCKMMAIRFPQQNRVKYNPSPISDYDCTNNLNLMKKVLNKHGLQLNLNVNDILHSKNNYELAKWFKALIDRQIIADQSGSNVQGMSRTSSCFNNVQLDMKKSNIETPKNRVEKVQFFRKGGQSAEKRNTSNHSSNIKRLSMAKSENHFFKDKKPPTYNQVRIPKFKSKNEINQDNRSAKMIKNQSFRSLNFEEKPQENIKNMLYERALEQSIEGFQNILARIEKAAMTDCADYETYRKAIYSAIFSP